MASLGNMYDDSIDLTGERITEGKNDLEIVNDALNRKSPKFKPQKKHTSSVNIHIDEDQIQALSEKKPRNRTDKKKESVTPNMAKPNMTAKFNQIIRFGSDIDKEMDAVQSNLHNYKELMKKKQKLDQRHEIFYGGKANQIFPDMERLEKLGPLAVKKKVVKTVKFGGGDVIGSNSSIHSRSLSD